MDLDLTCVESFLVLLRAGSYSRAAVELHVTQSALTKRVQRLERQVGVPLVVRDPTGVVGGTRSGLRFAAKAPALLASARAAREAARAAAAPEVHLGVPGRVGDFPERRHLRDLARRFHEQAPGVRLVCRGVPLAETVTCLETGEVDVAWFVVGPTPAALEAAPILDLERVVVVPAEHPLAEAERVSVADVESLPLLFLPDTPPSVMAPFLLSDVRPVDHIPLVPSPGRDTRTFIEALQPGQTAVVSASAWPASSVKPGARDLRIVDIPLIPAFAARRCGDRRTAVRTLMELLPLQAARMRLNIWDPAPERPADS